MLNKLCDELQIQRCLDNELSPEETRRLLLRLNELPDGWKTLACGFLEERAFSHAVTGRDLVRRTGSSSDPSHAVALSADATRGLSDVPSGVFGSVPPPGAPVPETTRPKITTPLARFWSHPMVSLSLCAAIAFVAGLIVQDQRPPNPAAGVMALTSRDREPVDPAHGTAPPQAVILSVSGNSGQGSAAPTMAERNQEWLQDLQQDLQDRGYSVRLRQIGPNILVDKSSERRHIISLLQQLTEQIEGPDIGFPGDSQRVPIRPRP